MDSNRDNPHKQRWPDSKSSTHINPYPSIHSGWWYTYPSEKYESQLGLLFPIYGKIKKVSKPPTSIPFVSWFQN